MSATAAYLQESQALDHLQTLFDAQRRFKPRTLDF